MDYQLISAAELAKCHAHLAAAIQSAFDISLEMRAGYRDASHAIVTGAQVEVVNRALNAMAGLCDIIDGEPADDVRERMDNQLAELQG